MYVFTDHLGNTRLLVDPVGAGIMQASAYYPYGLRIGGLHQGLIDATGPSTNEELYNGKELTDSHGLNGYHDGARYDDVAMARWRASDPADEFYSPYTYVGGDPVNFVDPDGMASQSPDEFFMSASGEVVWSNSDKATHEVDGQKFYNIGETFYKFNGHALTRYSESKTADGTDAIQAMTIAATSGVRGTDLSVRWQREQGLRPTPEGLYRMPNQSLLADHTLPDAYRLKDGGLGFYVNDLVPVAADVYGRSGLEIHFDGNSPGTRGCVEICVDSPGCATSFARTIRSDINVSSTLFSPILGVQYW